MWTERDMMQKEEMQSEEMQMKEMQKDEMQGEEMQTKEVQGEEMQMKEMQDEEMQKEEMQTKEVQGEEMQKEMQSERDAYETDLKKKQMENLRDFDRELFVYTGEFAWFIKGILVFFMLIWMLIPIQATEWYSVGRLFFLYCPWMTYFVLLPYVNTTEPMTKQSKKKKTYGKLRYLPIGKGQYVRVRMEYLCRFLWKITLAGVVAQGIGTVLDNQVFGIGNVLYVVWALLVLPMCCGWVLLMTES